MPFAHSIPRQFNPSLAGLPAVLFRCLLLTLTLLVSRGALAAPEAKILRIDPRVSQTQGEPILTTVLEVVEHKPLQDLIGGCAGLRGDPQLDCVSQVLDNKPLYTAFPFPYKNALFTVNVEGSDLPAKYKQHSRWGESQERAGVGTAWLILIDADRRIDKGFEDAKQVAQSFVNSMGPNDIVNIQFFDDVQVVKTLEWTPAAQKARAGQFISSVEATFPSRGRNRALFTLLKNAATSGFNSLGNVGQTGVNIPLHQAMVVISTGYGGTDPSTTGPGALQAHQYMTEGRLGNNTALPKMPTPVISIYVPTPTWDEFKQNSTDFMQNLANPEVGGYYTVLRPGQGARAPKIVGQVRTRFANMYVVEWRISCLAPTIEQTFKLVFTNVTPPILGDNTFKDVPIGVNPKIWPLDVNLDYSQKMAERDEGVFPGGTFKVFGNFCWGGSKERAEVYFLPAGQPLPTSLSGADEEQAQRTQQQLIAMGMKGETIEANDGFAEFRAPDKEKILHGSGKKAVVRLVIYDSKAHRISGITANRIIELRGTTQPFYALFMSPIVLALAGAVVLLLLVLFMVLIFRGGGKRRGSPPPAPVAAGPGYPPGGYGGGSNMGYNQVPGNPGPPAGGSMGYNPALAGGYGGPAPVAAGYGAPAPVAANYGSPAPVAPAFGGPPPAAPGAFGPAVASPATGPFGPPAAVAAAQQPPAFGAPQQGNHEFMFGQGQQAPRYGLTNDIPAVAAPPPDPYAAGGPSISRAVLQGSAGVFTVHPGLEMRVGRDGSQCGILLSEPRVSGVHATLRIDGAALAVRDENSNNGTVVNGNRLPPATWTPVPNGSLLRFGPVEFSVHLE